MSVSVCVCVSVQIPLSEFLLTHRGYVQNEQATINSDRIKTIGILLADRREGPFQLDIREVRAVTAAEPSARMDRTNARMKTEWRPSGSEHRHSNDSSNKGSEQGAAAAAADKDAPNSR